MSEYTKQAEDFLQASGITFSAVLVGDDCPMFCEDAQRGREMDKINTFPRKSHIHGKHYRCTFTRPETEDNKHFLLTHSRTLFIDFWNSYADEEYNALGSRAYRDGGVTLKYGREGKRAPIAYDVLASIQKNEPGTFEDFCSDFGYGSDSRRALTVYEAVTEEWRKIVRFFNAAEIEQLQEIS